MNWNKPESLEIKMDAEISSYQDDSYDPAKDGPLFIEETPVDASMTMTHTPRA